MTLQLGSDFDGVTYVPELDKVRLTGQLKRVHARMSDSRWHTIGDICKWLSVDGKRYSEAGISARIRDLRKAKFGEFEVQRKRINNLFYYRLVVGQTDMFH